MKSSVALVISVLAVLAAVLLVSNQNGVSEGFDAAGLVFNQEPEWMHKAAYRPSQWVVQYNPDQLSSPSCMHFRGDPEELNYLSSAYRFWRM